MVVRVAALREAVDAADELVAAAAAGVAERARRQQEVVVVAALHVADAAERRRVEAGVVVRAVEEKRAVDDVGGERAAAVGEFAPRVVSLGQKRCPEHARVVQRQERLRIVARGQAGQVVDVRVEADVRPFRADAERRRGHALPRAELRGQLPLPSLLIVSLGVADGLGARHRDRLPRRVVRRPTPGGEEPETVPHDVAAERRFPDVVQRRLARLPRRRLRRPARAAQ